jgi:hypothetical protein
MWCGEFLPLSLGREAQKKTKGIPSNGAVASFTYYYNENFGIVKRCH